MMDPNLGRWTKQDPLGYVDGPNLQEFVGSNPVRWTDPLGLTTSRPQDPETVRRAAIAAFCKRSPEHAAACLALLGEKEAAEAFGRKVRAAHPNLPGPDVEEAARHMYWIGAARMRASPAVDALIPEAAELHEIGERSMGRGADSARDSLNNAVAKGLVDALKANPNADIPDLEDAINERIKRGEFAVPNPKDPEAPYFHNGDGKP